MEQNLVEVVDRITPPLWIFGFTVVFYFFHKQKQQAKARLYDRIHAERLKAIEHGVPYPELPPYVDEEEEKSVHHMEKSLNPRWPLGLAAILMMGGAGMLVALIISPEEDLRRYWTFAFIPIFVGIGSCLHYFILRTGGKDRQ